MEAHLRWADQTLDELRKMARKQKRPSEVRKEKNRARK